MKAGSSCLPERATRSSLTVESNFLTTAAFFKEDLGMELVGVKAHNIDRFVEDIVTDLNDPQLQITVAAGQPAEELAVLYKLKPDIYCGHMGANGWVSRLGIPNLPLFGTALNYMGYSGAYDLGRKAAKAVLNTSFTKNVSANVGLPLTRAWLERDTRLNIKETEII